MQLTSISNTPPMGACPSINLIIRGLDAEVASLLSQCAHWAGPRTLNHQAHIAPSRGRFFVSAAKSMAAGIGHPSGWPVPGPVFATLCQPSPNQPRTDRDGFQNNQESKMSTSPKGTPPKIRTFPSSEILQGVLAELEASADLVEQLLTHGNDQAILETVSKSLVAMADLLHGGR